MVFRVCLHNMVLTKNNFLEMAPKVVTFWKRGVCNFLKIVSVYLPVFHCLLFSERIYQWSYYKKNQKHQLVARLEEYFSAVLLVPWKEIVLKCSHVNAKLQQNSENFTYFTLNVVISQRWSENDNNKSSSLFRVWTKNEINLIINLVQFNFFYVAPNTTQSTHPEDYMWADSDKEKLPFTRKSSQDCAQRWRLSVISVRGKCSTIVERNK